MMIETVLLDIDGVLTDGAVWINAAGEETKRILFDDIDAVFALKRRGLKLGFLTGEDTTFCRFVESRFRPDFLISGCKDKLAAFKGLEKSHGLNPKTACYVGDSSKDAELLRYVAFGFAPADAVPEARAAARETLPARRGEGVVREAARVIFGVNDGGPPR